MNVLSIWKRLKRYIFSERNEDLQWQELLLNVKKRYQERKVTVDLHNEGIDYCNKNKSDQVLSTIDKLLGGRNQDPDRALAQVNRLIV